MLPDTPISVPTLAQILQHAGIASQGWRDHDEAKAFLDTALVSVGPNERAYTAYKQSLSKIDGLLVSLGEAYVELTQARIRLGREHNQRARINTLPTEILMIIMQTVVAQDESRRLAAPLQVSAVCSYWRSVALNTSSLWSLLNFARMRWEQIRLYRERARDSPLTLLSFEGEKLAKEMFWSSLTSLKSLDLAKCPDILTATPTSSLHALETFVYKVLFQDTRSPPSPVLQTPLFQGKTPLLRHLTLIAVRMPWNYGYYVNLESLTLRSCCMDKFAQDEDICHVLRDCPRLRKLEMSARPEDGDATATRPPFTLQSAERAPLRSLQSLKLRLRAVFVSRILSSIETTDALSEVDIEILPLDAADVVSASSIPYLLPVAVLSRLDSIHILPWVDFSRSFGGELKGFATGATSSTQPLLALAWPRRGRDQLPDFGESMFMHCARALRLRRQSQLPLTTVAVHTRPFDHCIDLRQATRLIRVFELTDFVLPQGQGLSLDALPLANNSEEEQHYLNCASLEELSFNGGKLSYRRASEMMRWADQQESLRALDLSYVEISVQSKKSWEHLEKNILNLGLKLTMQNCKISFLDGTALFWKDLNLSDDEGEDEYEDETEDKGEEEDEDDN